MKPFIYGLGLVLVSLAIYVTFFTPSTIPLSPLGTPLESSVSNPKASAYIVLGFAPYWNLKKLNSDSLHSITHFAYFNLHINGDGSLYTKVNRREEDPGYTNYKRLVTGTIDYGSKPLILTFMPESQVALTNIVSTRSNRQAAIATIVESVNESHASGVNIDFEPVGEIDANLREGFVTFIRELRNSLNALLTISIYPSAASRTRLWDLAGLAPLTDYFVVMTYDYTMPGDSKAGPNAPLRGSGDIFNHDIVKNIAEITQVVSPRQVLLGIPLYGYEWETMDTTKYAAASSKGSVASLERIQKMLDNQTLELLWDRNTLTPYGIASNSGQISQIYFENETSIKLKLDFVKSAGLGGIAVWALGYEGNTSWLWPTINTLNR